MICQNDIFIEYLMGMLLALVILKKNILTHQDTTLSIGQNLGTVS